MHPQPLFKIFGQGIYAYGVCMAVGILACFAFTMLVMWKRGFNEEASDKLIFMGVFGTGFGIFSAALFQAIYDVIANPDAGFHLKGMTFIGGLIGGVVSFLGVWWLYVYVIAPRTKIKLLQNNMNAGLCDLLPFVPISIVIAHAFGRLGCFFAGCCYGRETDAWYGIHCAGTYYENTGTVVIGPKVVPTQLFECLFLVAIGIAMVILFFKFRFNCNFSVYLIGYGIWRFLIEYVRDDYRGEFIGGITPSQFWSILMVLLGVGYIFLYKYIFKRHMKHPELEKSSKNTGGDKPAEPAQA